MSEAGVGGERISLCAIRAGDGLYGIDTREVREVLGATAPERVPLAPKFVAGVVPYRGQVLTTVSLRALLGLESGSAGRCVLVLEDEEKGERFGLLVDGVGGVLTLDAEGLAANPSGLDARGTALFDGAFQMDEGLVVRLDPRRLRPSRLAESEMFAGRRQEERKA